jgi:hypothetical protein
VPFLHGKKDKAIKDPWLRKDDRRDQNATME